MMPHVHVGVEAADGVHVVRIDPESQRGAHGVVEGRLAPLLAPGADAVRPLYRQAVAIRQVLDEGVVPQLVRGLEDGGDH